jgi:hypothetical protein
VRREVECVVRLLDGVVKEVEAEISRREEVRRQKVSPPPPLPLPPLYPPLVSL